MADQDSKSLESARLADFMCFSVYTTNLAYSCVYRPVLEKLRLTYPQYIAIISLWEEDKQTVKGLSDKLYLEPSTVTPMLKKLEAMGYLTRVRDTEDERVVRVSLTDAGRRLREQGLQFSPLTVKASGLDRDEFVALQRAIVKLRNNLISSSEKL